MKSKELGNIGERLAIRYLKSNYYTIIFHNYHCRYGEIDIIAQKKKLLAFVEVKTRSSTSFGEPIDAVTEQKRDKIIKTAYNFLGKYPEYDKYGTRFDVICITYFPKNKQFQLKHYQQAFLGKPISDHPY